MNIAMDKTTGDMIVTSGGPVRVSGGRQTIQVVTEVLRTILGEWVADRSVGYVALGDLKKNPDMFDLEMRAVERILSVDGVERVTHISVDLDRTTRVGSIDFEAITSYGVIRLNVPWGAA